MKYLRIKKNADFQKLFRRGKKVFSPYITLLYFPSHSLKMGVAVSKKHGKAVERNRIKRLLRAAFADSSDKLEQPCSVILLPAVRKDYDYAAYKKSLETCFKKVNEWEKG